MSGNEMLPFGEPVDKFQYAIVAWTPEDVLSFRPEWSRDAAEAWLEEHSREIQDRLVALGWDVIRDLLPPRLRPVA